MNLERIKDIVSKDDDEFNRYRVNFTLNPERLVGSLSITPPLTWSSIKYGAEEIGQIPNDKRGLYAFAIHIPSDALPTHGYILYIGMAGKNSERSLRERYRDYLTESKVIRRPRVRRMIARWDSLLRFFFAPVENDVSSDDLRRMEKQLNTAFMPPFSPGDLEAGVGPRVRAFL